MVKFETKRVKLVSVVITVFFLLGMSGIALSQSGKTNAAPVANVGFVDFQLLLSQHPDMAAAQDTIKKETEQAQKDFNAKAATITNEQEKQNYFNQLQQRLSARQQELLSPIQDKVVAAVKEVADAKGLEVVLDISAQIYGGQDITAEVGKKITGK